MDLRPGDTVPGPSGSSLTITREIGAGGFGQVFAADAGPLGEVAVKTVHTANLTESALKVFQNELRAAVLVKHANVVDVLHVDDGSTTPGRPPYLVMEYVDGGSLRDVIDSLRAQGSQLAVPELCAMCLQIASGMEALNAKLVHRDLKPENVLRSTGATAQLKIADFGLAKLAEAATRSGTFKGWGTPPYMAPESFDLGQSTFQVDIYAAGVVFFELATLSLPLTPAPNDQSMLGWRNAHLLTAPRDARKARPDLPAGFAQLVLTMLSKDARKRPQSWSEVQQRLTNLNTIGQSIDVSDLVGRATERLNATMEAEAKAAEARTLADERRKLLESAFQDVVAISSELVAAFNDATAVGKILEKRTDPQWVEYLAPSVGRLLILQCRVTEDIEVPGLGIVRCLVSVRLEPRPTPQSEHQAYNDSDTMSGFNAVYAVSRAEDRFGSWTLFRFEHNPLTQSRAWPRWFGLEVGELPRQLMLLRAMGLYQHEQSLLDEKWMRKLLGLMV